MIKFSVIIPTYNTSKYIEECLKNIIATKYKNLEVIIIDDSSTDNTYEIVNRFIKQLMSIHTLTIQLNTNLQMPLTKH